jgi:hypothetical protein
MTTVWIGAWLTIGAGLIAVLPGAPPADAAPRAVCRDAADCNVAGTRELNAGRMPAAQAAFETEVCFAWREGETAQIVRAHNNLSLLALRRGEPLEARLWAGLALVFDQSSRAARHNARLADEGVAALPSAQGVTGTYWHRWGESLGHEVAIQELPDKRIRFALHAVSIIGSPCHARDYNEGGAYGYASLAGRVATLGDAGMGRDVPAALYVRTG